MVFISAPDQEGVIEKERELPYRRTTTSPHFPTKIPAMPSPAKAPKKSDALV